MKLKMLSVYEEFVNFIRNQAAKIENHVKLGDLLLTFKLLNTVRLSSESKLTYAYLFFHRRDVTGFKIPILSDSIGMRPKLVRNVLQELESKKHIKLIRTEQTADLSGLTYYYEIVDPTRYGMLDLEKEQFKEEG